MSYAGAQVLFLPLPSAWPLPRIPGAASPSFSFRFPSRFHLYIPVFVTVAPVSYCCGLYLADAVTVW
jgi:hypothetical protein